MLPVRKYRIELYLLLGGLAVLVFLFFAGHALLEASGLAQLVAWTGVPLDDVYIHCRYAENLLAGNGYTFNPGATVTADTSPLWVILIALGGLVTDHLDVVAILWSAFFYLLLIVSAYRFAKRLGIEEGWSIIAGFLVMLSARLVWSSLSGMEVTLASVLVLAALTAHFDRRRTTEGILLALGVAVRPELMLLAVVLLVDLAIAAFRGREQVGSVLQLAGSFLISVFPVFLLPLLERGSLFYHSSVVQGTGLSADPGYLFFAGKILLATVTPPIVVALASLYYFRKDRRFTLVHWFAFGLPIALALIAPQYRHHGRYFFPIIPLLIILGVAVLAKLLNRRKPFWTLLVIFLLTVHTMIGALRWAQVYANSLMNITGQHVAVADWVSKNTSTADVLAAHDVGALGYFTKRPVIDLVGLVSPELYPLQHDQRLVWEYARARGATVFIIYNRLNPGLYAYAKDSLVLEANFRVEPLVASADTVLSIYRVRDHADR